MQVLLVIDMQNAVFSTPRYHQTIIVGRINQLIDAAEQTIFVQHTEDGMLPGSHEWKLLPEIRQPENAIYVTKTACDAFYRTTLSDELAQRGITHLTVCGCATDYCVDATIKNAASRGYAMTVAGDAHTTADRRVVSAEQLIAQHNDVWRDFIIPGNTLLVKDTWQILAEWEAEAQ
ncbi:isochorismatase [Prodigiosinella confusarubida]|uniref:Isochorismatase n=1 Tax=Serratia sp. (strain ATCC 39006) TaxID=104623 RepID=A0A2I5TIF2_SERS3|nr:isochorismatase family protein [Serratia sp. ATCC 39006]AUH00026.1 isochorismatase [Serratia sp. ATCC 39006]AUH04345.1 isochorismatase [Serratia sp. ATCC 39006]